LNRIGSVIDRPRKDLSLWVWDKRGRLYFLKPDLRKAILDRVFSFLRNAGVLFRWRFWLQDVVIGGSYTTNQYRDDSDLDVQVLVDYDKMAVVCGFRSSADAYVFMRDLCRSMDFVWRGLKISFMASRWGKEFRSPGLYSVLRDKWLRPPFFMPLEVDIDELFSVQKRLAEILYRMIKEGKLSEGFVDWFERRREIENFYRGDYNEVNVTYKYLERFLDGGL